jgi:hypothetical protein
LTLCSGGKKCGEEESRRAIFGERGYKMKNKAFKNIAPLILLISLTFAEANPSQPYNSSNFGVGFGMRWIDFDLKFNNLSQKYSTANTGGLNIYFQKHLTSKYGVDVTIYQEWNGHKKLKGINDSGLIEIGTYSSEGGSGMVRIGAYREIFGFIQIGLNIGACALGLHPSDIIANDFNGGSLSIIPTLKLSSAQMSKHGFSFITYGGMAIFGNFTGPMLGGAANYEFRIRQR